MDYSKSMRTAKEQDYGRYLGFLYQKTGYIWRDITTAQEIAVPEITGNQLYYLLVHDGWEIQRQTNVGVCMRKRFKKRVRYAGIPVTEDFLSASILKAILGPAQTSLGVQGLMSLAYRFYGKTWNTSSFQN